MLKEADLNIGPAMGPVKHDEYVLSAKPGVAAMAAVNRSMF